MEYAMVVLLVLTRFILHGYFIMIFIVFAKNSENDRKMADLNDRSLFAGICCEKTMHCKD